MTGYNFLLWKKRDANIGGEKTGINTVVLDWNWRYWNGLTYIIYIYIYYTTLHIMYNTQYYIL